MLKQNQKKRRVQPPVVRRSQLHAFEMLEPRRVLASAWQNPVLHSDTDGSGFVAAVDALHVVNDINRNGVRPLPAVRPADYLGPQCDTNGDGVISGIDVLQIVNAINQFPDGPTLAVRLTEASDRNGDQVVLQSGIHYQGTSTPHVLVKVERLVAGQSNVVVFQTTASSMGEFEVPLTLDSPVTHLRFTISDPRGRSVVTERIVRQGDVVNTWNAALLEVIRESTSFSTISPGLLIKPPPPMVARYLAMVHGAMADAIAAVDGSYASYLPATTVAEASPIAAAAVAAHTVAAAIYPAEEQMVVWDRTLAEVMERIPEGSAKSLGTQVGQRAAAAILANRALDGSASLASYPSGTLPGQWRPTAPDYASATLPQWPGVQPFAIASGDAFRPSSMPVLDSAAYAEAVNEVMRLGSFYSTDRTVDQTAMAHFWADGGGTSTPPGHWNQIAMDVGLQQQLSVAENARMMALLNYAMADSGIAAWDAKFALGMWRPIDAIQRADTDGRADTVADASWTPLLTTPSFPAYVSGHSAFSGAAAEVLTQLFGDSVSFTTFADRGSGGAWPPSDDVQSVAQRSFASFHQAAQEAGASRIYGGIHFSFDNFDGLAIGKSVGELVATTLLLPS